jgi:hypothetical protein
LPSATQLVTFAQRRKPAASADPQLPLQQSVSCVQISSNDRQPPIGVQALACNPGTGRHNVSQHGTKPHGWLSVRQALATSQRPALHAPLQQSDDVVQKSPCARQNE